MKAKKRELLKRAAHLLGEPELARRLNVPSSLLDDWIHGADTMPDAKLMDLARVLDKVGRENRASKIDTGS